MELTLNSAMEIAVQTLVGLYAAMPMKVVMLALALLCCLAGYRLLRLVSACIGVFAGVMLGVCVTSLFSASLDGMLGLGLTVLAMVVLGGAGGVLFFYRRACGVFVLCAGIGAAVVYLPALFAPAAAQAAIVAAGALLFGVTGVLLVRPAGILTTALLGLFAAYALFDLLGQAQGAGTAVLGVLLVVAGCAVQALPRRKTGKSGAADAVDAMDTADAVAAERRDGGDGQRLGEREGGGQRILDGYGELALTGGAERGGAVLRRLHNLDLEIGLLVVAHGLGDVEAGVVGVGRPVEGEGDLLQARARSRCAGAARGCALAARATGECDGAEGGGPRQTGADEPAARHGAAGDHLVDGLDAMHIVLLT